MVEFNERREYFRINVDCEIEYQLLNSDKVYKGRCTTLSGAGVSFVSNKLLKLDDELEMTIQSQHPATPPLRAHVRVVNVRSLEDKSFVISASMTVLHDDGFLSL
jgi:c-di-GMP-binding flagellar brake protein YcgR